MSQLTGVKTIAERLCALLPSFAQQMHSVGGTDVFIVLNHKKISDGTGDDPQPTTDDNWYQPSWKLEAKDRGIHSERMKFLSEPCKRKDRRQVSAELFCRYHKSLTQGKDTIVARRKDSDKGCHFAHIVNPKTSASATDQRTELLNEILHFCDNDQWHPIPRQLEMIRKNEVERRSRTELKFYLRPTANSFTARWLGLKMGTAPVDMIKQWMNADATIERCAAGTKYERRFAVALAAWTKLRVRFVAFFVNAHEKETANKVLAALPRYAAVPQRLPSPTSVQAVTNGFVGSGRSLTTASAVTAAAKSMTATCFAGAARVPSSPSSSSTMLHPLRHVESSSSSLQKQQQQHQQEYQLQQLQRQQQEQQRQQFQYRQRQQQQQKQLQQQQLEQQQVEHQQMMIAQQQMYALRVQQQQKQQHTFAQQQQQQQPQSYAMSGSFMKRPISPPKLELPTMNNDSLWGLNAVKGTSTYDNKTNTLGGGIDASFSPFFEKLCLGSFESQTSSHAHSGNGYATEQNGYPSAGWSNHAPWSQQQQQQQPQQVKEPMPTVPAIALPSAESEWSPAPRSSAEWNPPPGLGAASPSPSSHVQYSEQGPFGSGSTSFNFNFNKN